MMRDRRQCLCFWPGLPQLWLRGCWWGLLFAVTFTVLFNFALAVTFLWPAWVPVTAIVVSWLLVLVTWLASVLLTIQQMPKWTGNRIERRDMDHWFQEAQCKYLQGHYLEAETILTRLIRKDPLDLEARLMIATVCRRTDRHNQSRHSLRELERLEGSVKWKWEIRQEREWLNRNKPAISEEKMYSKDLSEAA